MTDVKRFTYTNPGASVAVALQAARDRTLAADAPAYARLPPPVRYRATGAIDARRCVMHAGRHLTGADFHTAISTFPLARLYDEFPSFMRGWARSTPSTATDENIAHAQRSLVWQVYHASDGAMYEPTAALHRLLEGAYIADDVPVEMIELPAPAMCIIPPAEWRGCREGIRTIVLFRRRKEIRGVYREYLDVATWQEFRDGLTRIKTLQYVFDDAGKTIQQLLDRDSDASLTQEQHEADREHWRLVFDYAVKLLLYLKLPDCEVVADRAYSDAPRQFHGLGQRKRRERLAQLEHLYDRHIVGPAVLNWDLGVSDSAEAGLARHEKGGHWRRPHFRMQPHGPRASLRKLVFIGPVIVRPDRLGL